MSDEPVFSYFVKGTKFVGLLFIFLDHLTDRNDRFSYITWSREVLVATHITEALKKAEAPLSGGAFPYKPLCTQPGRSGGAITKFTLIFGV